MKVASDKKVYLHREITGMLVTSSTAGTPMLWWAGVSSMHVTVRRDGSALDQIYYLVFYFNGAAPKRNPA